MFRCLADDQLRLRKMPKRDAPYWNYVPVRNILLSAIERVSILSQNGIR
jgi:hypothetical protein